MERDDKNMHVFLASFQARYSKIGFSKIHGQNESFKGLIDMLDDEHEIIIWTPDPRDPQWRGILRTEELISKINEKDPEIIHLVLPTPNFRFIADKVAKKFKTPLIVQYNSSLIREQPPNPGDLSDVLWLGEKIIVNHELGGKLLSICPRKKDFQIIVSSEFQKRQLIHSLNLSESRVTTIPNSSRMSLYQDESWSKTSKISKKIHFGYLGHVTLAKGVEDLVNAFGEINCDDAELHLALSGKGKDIKKKFEFEKDSRVHVEGVVERKSFFRKIDAIVLPYRCAFGTQVFPNTLLEALYSGTPVISSRLPYMEEIIKEEKNGLLFNPRDIEGLTEKLEMFCKNPSLQKKISGSEVPQKLKLESIKNKLEKLYEKTVTSHER